MNGRVFNGLAKLSRLELKGNQCIDEDFLDKETVSKVSKVVNEKCGSVEASEEK